MIGGSPSARRALATVGILALVFLTVPIVIVIPMSFSSALSHLSVSLGSRGS